MIMGLLRWLAKQLFTLLGWQIVGDLPPYITKAVVVMAPHTSQWDLFYVLMSTFIKQIPAKFAIKKEAMFFPIGPILRCVGAIPIHRGGLMQQDKPLSQVGLMVDMLATYDNLLLMIAPEGTRQYAPQWRTGFYYTALQAQVPLVLSYLDYARKEAGIGPIFYPTGCIEEDLKEIQAFYRDKSGKYPDQGVR